MSDGKKKLAVWVEGAIVANLQRWQDEYDKTESEVVRVALILGLQALRRDPSPLGMKRLDPDSISPPPGAIAAERDAKARVDAAEKEAGQPLPPPQPTVLDAGPTPAQRAATTKELNRQLHGRPSATAEDKHAKGAKKTDPKKP